MQKSDLKYKTCMQINCIAELQQSMPKPNYYYILYSFY